MPTDNALIGCSSARSSGCDRLSLCNLIVLLTPSGLQGVGQQLRSSPRQEWGKLVEFCKATPGLQDDTDWAVQQITHAMRI